MPNLVSKHTEILLDRVTGILSNADEDEFIALTGRILACERIFIVGTGRSGLVGKFFAMRLMHLGKTVYIVGETTTPSITSNDLLIAVSGSGDTTFVVHVAETAKAHNADIVGIFLQKDSYCSELERLSNQQIRMDRRYLNKQRGDFVQPETEDVITPNILPMGTLFEISALIYFESVVAEIIRFGHIREDTMKLRHSNLE